MGTAHIFTAENVEYVFGAISELDEHARLDPTCDFGIAGHVVSDRCGTPRYWGAWRSVRDIHIVILRLGLDLLYTIEGPD